MNKVDYIVIVAATFFSFYIIWNRKDKKKKNNFDKEIFDLKNAVEITARKIGE